MRNIIFILLFVVAFSYTYAEFEFAGNIKNYKVFDNRIEFELTNSKFNLYVIDNNIIRFRFTNQKDFSLAPSYAITYPLPSKSKFSLNDQEDRLIIKTDELIINISKKPCRISIYDTNNNLLNQDEESFGVAFDNDEVRCFKKLFNDEKFYGLGEKTDGLLRNGKQYKLWNTDFPAYTSRSDELYQSIPFFIGIRNYKAYGIFFDNTYKSYFNFGASNNRFYWFGAEGGEMDYYFIYGPDIKRVISDYTKLTGRIHLPPLWSLGYQQSRYSYYPESLVRTIANTFRERKIPCDVIYFDIHYMDEYRVFTWNKERFPDPEKLLRDLKNLGFKVVTIIDPGVKVDSNYFVAQEGVKNNLFARYPDGTFYQGEVWPSWAYFPDFTKEATRTWWGEKIGGFLNQGVEGIWNDMNEPAVWGQNFPDIVLFDDNGFTASHKKIHNVYGLSMAKATYDGLRKYSNKRHFILTRAGFSGIQRYAAVWTGDNIANDEHLYLACTMSLNMGLSGVPFIGSDVGGFIGEPSDELIIRWYQLGAFTPFFRGHSAIDTRFREPYTFGDFVEPDIKRAIQLRYKLLPFWYNEFYNSTQTGLPIMRAMFVNYQYDENSYYHDAQYQFMIGENLLVAPVLNSYDKFKKLYLPAGRWYDWDENKVIDGGKWIIKEVPINKIPIFLKEGGIIPMQEVLNYVGEKNVDSLQFLIFPSAKSEYTFYEDDGISYDNENGKYSLTKFLIEQNSKSIKLSVEKIKNDYQSSVKKYNLKFVGIDKPRKINLNKKEIKNYSYEANTLMIDLDVSNFITLELIY
ncbi:glycoside hydrolase family 31 protein [Rosettibacter firmus]|uniref:glycoside hydrolase family 31 protein n=1 Tax=Rosettibacter firmus TaxID=3111522 RepID=UPI00336C175C